MSEIITLAQAGAVISASWAIVSGIGAWKREFIGKRRIELAEQVLAKFFELQDAISYIRNPFSSGEEGKSRKPGPAETAEEAQLLDRGYIVIERYGHKEVVFAEFNMLKYKFMASFGKETGAIFTDTNKAVNSIFVSARMLAHHYWQRQGRVEMEAAEFQRHLEEMRRHEGIFWDVGDENDEIRTQLRSALTHLESTTAACFEEPMRTYVWLTKPISMLRRKPKAIAPVAGRP